MYCTSLVFRSGLVPARVPSFTPTGRRPPSLGAPPASPPESVGPVDRPPPGRLFLWRLWRPPLSTAHTRTAASEAGTSGCAHSALPRRRRSLAAPGVGAGRGAGGELQPVLSPTGRKTHGWVAGKRGKYCTCSTLCNSPASPKCRGARGEQSTVAPPVRAPTATARLGVPPPTPPPTQRTACPLRV